MKSHKICCNCKLEKPLSEFATDKKSCDGHAYQCRKCYKHKYEQNIEINRVKSLNYYHKHQENQNKKSLQRYYDNKSQCQENHKQWKLKNKDQVKEYRKRHYSTNKEKIARQRALHYRENIDYYKVINKQTKEKLKDKINIYVKNKYNEDSNFKITAILRSRLIAALKNDQKKGRTLELLGCTIEHLKNHLQQTAINNGYFNFDINNYSGKKYNIDHIIPCAAFNLKCGYHQKLCFHWSNLQILETKTNISKYNKFALAA